MSGSRHRTSMLARIGRTVAVAGVGRPTSRTQVPQMGTGLNNVASTENGNLPPLEESRNAGNGIPRMRAYFRTIGNPNLTISPLVPTTETWKGTEDGENGEKFPPVKPLFGKEVPSGVPKLNLNNTPGCIPKVRVV